MLKKTVVGNRSIMQEMMLVSFLFVFSVFMVFTKAQAAEPAANVTVSRADGECTYSLSDLDTSVPDSELTVQVANKSTGEKVLEKTYEINQDSHEGKVSLEDLKYEYATYTMTILVNDTVIKTEDIDFTIHTNKVDLSVLGSSYELTRTFNLISTEPKDGVIVPGKGNKVSIYVWHSGLDASVQLGSTQLIAGSGVKWSDVGLAPAGHIYGTWTATAVLTNNNLDVSKTLATAQYSVAPKASSFSSGKSASLEKKQSFKVSLKGLKNPYDVKKVSFRVATKAGKTLATVSAVQSSSNYTATITYKSVKYTLDQLTITAIVQDTAGKKVALAKTAAVNLTVKPGTTTITKKQNATCKVVLKNAYVPGNMSSLKFIVYKVSGSKKTKIKTYNVTVSASKKKFSQIIDSYKVGDYKLYAYAYTAWNKKLLLSTTDYTITKKDMGKSGWYYEKYNGKKYRFYYENNKKVTDLTNILNIKKGGSNKFYIEVNRAAAVVTVYMYNNETNKYDTPVKAATVSVGRDIRTNAGAGALNIKSSFTPIGNYSICSNGAAVRYTLKPMHEPDGSTVYARWCTHIVGNVYFHSIAVGAQSHYALSARSYNRLGGPASAGCIRMTVADAKWLYGYAPTGTRVKINVGSSKKPGPLGKPQTIKIVGSGVNYDPTDPDVPDSRKKKDYKAKKITGYMTKSGKKVGYE